MGISAFDELRAPTPALPRVRGREREGASRGRTRDTAYRLAKPARALTLAIVAASFAAHAADLAPRLHHDPFAAKPSPLRALVAGDASPAVAVTHPPLRALLAAGPDSRVILGSQLLRLGESSGDYRLLQVRERSAIFEFDGRKVEVGLKSTVLP